MAASKPKIGFAGLGAMGGGMAKNLVKNGFPVVGYDVSQALLDDFVQAGGQAAKTAKEAAANADFMISMVANADQNTSLLFDGEDAAVHGLGADKTIILCSTVAPDFLPALRRRLDHDFHRPDVRLLDCPVSGGTLRAADGSLSIFASGPDAHVDAAGPVLDCLAGNLYRMGGEIGAGSRTKTVHQLLAATNIIAACEALALAASVGLHTPSVAQHVGASATAASFMFGNRAPHALADDWRPLSALAIILKDAGIVTATARKAQFPTPLAAAAEQQYLAGVRAGLLREDDAALVKLYLPAAQPGLVAEMCGADERMRESFRVSAETVEALLAGIHLAAAMEAMAFCHALDLDRRQMCEIVLKAAGWSAMFDACVPAMLDADRWSLADCPRAKEVGSGLKEAVEKCRAIGYPCPMASMAMEQFAFAELRDKKIQGLDRKSR